MKNLLFVLAAFGSVTAFGQCYTVAQAAYVADTTTYSSQIVPQITDDEWSQRIPIGFTFCFYGAQYDSVLVGTNGILTFTDTLSGQYCQWPIPTAAYPSPLFPGNSIMGVWQDLRLYQVPASRIFCWTSGTFPTRTFTVKYDSVPMYSCVTSYYSGRMILHETTNEIEVQVDNKAACMSWNAGKGILGIQNQAATLGISPAPYNAQTPGWTASQMAWIFTPICDVCNGVSIAEEDNRNEFSIYPNPSEGFFTLQIQDANSGIASYDVIDISGRVVHSAKVNAQTYLQFTLENSGMYFVRVYDETNTMLSWEKIVVE